MNFPERGSIYLVNFDPTVGAEIKIKRPALIVQNNIANEYSPLFSVAPITSQQNAMYRVEVEIRAPEGGLKKDSLVLVNQIRMIDRSRLIRLLGKVTPATMKKVEEALLIHFGIISV